MHPAKRTESRTVKRQRCHGRENLKFHMKWPRYAKKAKVIKTTNYLSVFLKEEKDSLHSAVENIN
jgi:hypothetical protein